MSKKPTLSYKNILFSKSSYSISVNEKCTVEHMLSGYETCWIVASVPCDIEYYASGAVSSNICSTWVVWFVSVIYFEDGVCYI